MEHTNGQLANNIGSLSAEEVALIEQHRKKIEVQYEEITRRELDRMTKCYNRDSAANNSLEVAVAGYYEKLKELDSSFWLDESTAGLKKFYEVVNQKSGEVIRIGDTRCPAAAIRIELSGYKFTVAVRDHEVYDSTRSFFNRSRSAGYQMQIRGDLVKWKDEQRWYKNVNTVYNKMKEIVKQKVDEIEREQKQKSIEERCLEIAKERFEGCGVSLEQLYVS